MAEHEMTTRATTAKTIHIDLIHRNFEVRAIAQRYADPRAEYHKTVAQPDGSGWNAVPRPVYGRYRKRIVDR